MISLCCQSRSPRLFPSCALSANVRNSQRQRSIARASLAIDPRGHPGAHNSSDRWDADQPRRCCWFTGSLSVCDSKRRHRRTAPIDSSVPARSRSLDYRAAEQNLPRREAWSQSQSMRSLHWRIADWCRICLLNMRKEGYFDMSEHSHLQLTHYTD